MKRAGLVFAMAMMAACGARADQSFVFVSGEELHTSCQAFLRQIHNPDFPNFTSKTMPDAMGYEDCVSYVEGVIDVAAGLDDSEHKLCLPESAVARTVAEIVANDLEKHPEHRHFTASSVVIGILQETYPCK
jgi:hypothetical protein